MLETGKIISAFKKNSSIILERREEMNRNSFPISNNDIATSIFLTVKHRKSLKSKIS